MNIDQLLEKRRAYRTLKKVELNQDLIKKLADAAKLAPSCFNNQPWRFIFVEDNAILTQIGENVSRGNEWVQNASLITAVFSKKDLDCQIKNREYYWFDTGMAAAFMILKATDLGLVAHPIAGFKEKAIKEILKIPDEFTLLTLINIGVHDTQAVKALDEKEAQRENIRPERLPFNEFAFLNQYLESKNQE